MCPSTVEYYQDGRVLSLPISDGKSTVATIRITEGGPADTAELVEIKETGNGESEDTETPILIVRSDAPPNVRIMLLEETDYGLWIDAEPGKEITEAFSYLRSNSGDMTLKSFGFGDRALYSLRFDSFVGKGHLDLTLDGIRYEVPFEVRSKKIGYRTQYPLSLIHI